MKVIHILGLPILLATTTVSAYMLYKILTQGVFIGKEENQLLALFEFFLCLFGLLYWVYLVKLLIIS